MRISFVRENKEIWSIGIEEERIIGIETKLLLPNSMRVSVRSKSWAAWSSRWEKIYIDEDHLKKAFDLFRKMVTCGDGALIPVAVAGKGKTDKSIRVRVRAELHPCRDRPREITEHTVTVPRSTLIDYDGVPHLPRWLIKRTIRERILAGQSWPKVVGDGVWPEAQQCWDQCFQPALDLWQRVEAENRARMAIALEQKAERQRETRRMAEQERLRRQEAPPKEKAPPAHQRLPMVQATAVEYDDWVKVGSGKDKRNKKVVVAVGDARLYFSAKQVVIETPDGKTIRKAQSNVRYAESPQQEGSCDDGLLDQ